MRMLKPIEAINKEKRQMEETSATAQDKFVDLKTHHVKHLNNSRGRRFAARESGTRYGDGRHRATCEQKHALKAGRVRGGCVPSRSGRFGCRGIQTFFIGGGGFLPAGDPTLACRMFLHNVTNHSTIQEERGVLFLHENRLRSVSSRRNLYMFRIQFSYGYCGVQVRRVPRLPLSREPSFT